MERKGVDWEQCSTYFIAYKTTFTLPQAQILALSMLCGLNSMYSHCWITLNLHFKKFSFVSKNKCSKPALMFNSNANIAQKVLKTALCIGPFLFFFYHRSFFLRSRGHAGQDRIHANLYNNGDIWYSLG